MNNSVFVHAHVTLHVIDQHIATPLVERIRPSCEAWRYKHERRMSMLHRYKVEGPHATSKVSTDRKARREDPAHAPSTQNITCPLLPHFASYTRIRSPRRERSPS